MLLIGQNQNKANGWTQRTYIISFLEEGLIQRLFFSDGRKNDEEDLLERVEFFKTAAIFQMYNLKLRYNTRSMRQENERKRRKSESTSILNKNDSNELSSDDESVLTENMDFDGNNHNNHPDVDNGSITDEKQLNEMEFFQPFDRNVISIASSESDEESAATSSNAVFPSSDPEKPLYSGCCISSKSAASSIVSTATQLNLSKSAVEFLLKLMKSLLPVPNTLPTTYDAIVKLTTDGLARAETVYYCNHCQQLCTLRSGKKICTNERCRFRDKSLGSRDISEIVTFDIKHQLESIISRNLSLIGKTKEFHSFDIDSGNHYKDSTLSTTQLNEPSECRRIHPIRLNIHTDGAPLIRTSKTCLWPCMASIVELPHHIREKQTNIIILALWTSSAKPDIDLFLTDTIKQLQQLSMPCHLSINGGGYTVVVGRQMFISDLPAKALFWKTINHNGYNACTSCLSEGTACRILHCTFPLNSR